MDGYFVLSQPKLFCDMGVEWGATGRGLICAGIRIVSFFPEAVLGEYVVTVTKESCICYICCSAVKGKRDLLPETELAMQLCFVHFGSAARTQKGVRQLRVDRCQSCCKEEERLLEVGKVGECGSDSKSKQLYIKIQGKVSLKFYLWSYISDRLFCRWLTHMLSNPVLENIIY